MKFSTYKIKQYNSTYKTVVCVDSVPFCITQSSKRASTIISALSGYGTDKIKDGKILKYVEKLLKMEEESK